MTTATQLGTGQPRVPHMAATGGTVVTKAATAKTTTVPYNVQYRHAMASGPSQAGTDSSVDNICCKLRRPTMTKLAEPLGSEVRRASTQTQMSQQQPSDQNTMATRHRPAKTATHDGHRRHKTDFDSNCQDQESALQRSAKASAGQRASTGKN